MYIYKMRYEELGNFSEEEINLLKDENVLVNPDYLQGSGCYEIMSDRVQELVENNNKELLDILADGVGTDVLELLKTNELDFLLVV